MLSSLTTLPLLLAVARTARSCAVLPIAGVLLVVLMVSRTVRSIRQMVCPMANLVTHVLAPRSIREIAQSIVGRITVKMTGLQMQGPWPQESLGDEIVNGDGGRFTALGNAHGEIPASGSLRKDESSSHATPNHARDTADAPLVRDLVLALQTRQRHPAFGRLVHIDSCVVGRAPGRLPPLRGIIASTIAQRGAV